MGCVPCLRRKILGFPKPCVPVCCAAAINMLQGAMMSGAVPEAADTDKLKAELKAV